MQTDLIKILKLIDLTSLSYTDTSNSIKNLINIGYTPYANVASICIYSQFLADAKQIIDAKNLNYSDINKVKLATVVNFPNGASDIDLTCIETDLAISRGANEIDLVFPYHSLIDGNYNIGAQMINKIKNICQNHAILKVIIESGILPNSQLITDASIISIQNGADFIFGPGTNLPKSAVEILEKFLKG